MRARLCRHPRSCGYTTRTGCSCRRLDTSSAARRCRQGRKPTMAGARCWPASAPGSRSSKTRCSSPAPWKTSSPASRSKRMIKWLVDLALHNKYLMLCAGVLLLVWGAFSFHTLPVEAYPDVANNWVQVITQWPGHAAEEVEQQVTIPIEVQMNGIGHLSNLRSTSLFGLSVVTLIFDDDSNNDLNRQKALEKLSLVTLPQGLNPQLGPDYSP